MQCKETLRQVINPNCQFIQMTRREPSHFVLNHHFQTLVGPHPFEGSDIWVGRWISCMHLRSPAMQQFPAYARNPGQRDGLQINRSEK